ncbi:MAG TPA: dipeptidase [Chroococcales cyanobacterium]
MKKFLSGMAVAFAIALIAGSLLVPPLIDKKFNLIDGKPIMVSAEAKRLHRSLLVVDLHADSLLWKRDLLQNNKYGHVDMPKLIKGNVALQAFTIVTSVPSKFVIGGHPIDQVTELAVADMWPLACWFSLKERVLFQITRLNECAKASGGKFRIIKSASDLDSYLKERSVNQSFTAGFIGIEGAHALEGDLNNIDLFYERGVRMMSPSHFFDNNVGGSSFGKRQGGLTTLGCKMIEKMQSKHMIVDLAHASSKTIVDVLRISKRPVVVSHTGVKGTCNNNRNLSDSEIIGIAKTGGVIGIGYWPHAICGNDARAIAKAIRYVSALVGVKHVALGSDFDGACTTPFDASALEQVTQALMDEHFNESQIRLIMGENALRVLREGLPP